MFFKPSSVAPLQGWNSLFQGIISGDGFMVTKPSSMTPSQRSWNSLFQGILSGVGHMFFQPSSLASLQGWCSFFNGSSLEMDTWFSNNHLLHLYIDDAAVYRLAYLDMDIWFSSHHL